MEVVWALVAFAVIYSVLGVFRGRLSAATSRGRLGVAKAWIHRGRWRSLLLLSVFWGSWMSLWGAWVGSEFGSWPLSFAYWTLTGFIWWGAWTWWSARHPKASNQEA